MANAFTRFFSNKVLLTATLLMLLCAGVWGYFFVNRPLPPMDAMRAVPSDAALVLRVNGLGKLARKLGAEDELAQLMAADELTAGMRRALAYTAGELAPRSEVAAAFARQPLWISAHVFGAELAFLYSLRFPDNFYLSDVRQLVGLLVKDGYAPHELAYDDEQIVTFRRGGVEAFHAAVVQRVLVVSPSRVLVEMAIRQAKAPSSLADNPSFVQAVHTAGAYVDANLYINHAQLPRLLPLCLNAPYGRQLGFVSRAGTFTMLDAELRSEALQLNGFLFFDPAAPSYFSVLAKQKSQKLTTFDILPRATDAVVCYGVSDVRQLLEAYDSFREQQQTGNAARREALLQLRKKLGGKAAEFDVEEFFAALHPSELAVAHVPMVGLEDRHTRFIVIKTGKMDAARAAMKKAVALAAKAEKKQEGDFVKRETMSNGEPLDVYRNPAPGLVAALQGDLFAACSDEYFAFIGGEHMVFASSQVAMREFALAALLKKTLAQAVDVSEYTDSESNAIIYVNPAKGNAFAQSMMKPDVQKALKNSPTVAASHGVGLQLRMMGDKVYCSAFFMVAIRAAKGLPLGFEVKLEAPAAAAPWVVKNHNSGQKEIVVQDKNNVVYLIDNRGALLWKKPLGEPIMGRVHQIDYYRNNKLQLLFNTRSKVHLIDRLGRNVDRFPLALPELASAPMAVFDYDRSRDYRYFVPCADRKIHAYDRSGKPLTGFAPEVAFGAIAQPPLHVRARDKDYIVVADERRVYILDRKGKERAGVKEATPVGANSGLFVETGAKGEPVRLATTGVSGDLLFIYFDGAVERVKLRPQPGGRHFFTCLSRGAGSSYVVLDDRELRVYEPGLTVRFAHTFKHAVHTAPCAHAPLPGVEVYSVYVADEQTAYFFSGGAQGGLPINTVAPLLVDNLRDSPTSYCVVACDDSGFLSCYNVQP